MRNECQFSPCRNYRYVLTHRWEELMPQREIAWIGLNPSTADEEQLDPTLRRVRNFSQRLGFNVFHMLNLFAFRATDPSDMKFVHDPVGPENNYWINRMCDDSDAIVACWGIHGRYLDRDKAVEELLSLRSIDCLGLTKEGKPSHPLYLSSDKKLVQYR